QEAHAPYAAQALPFVADITDHSAARPVRIGRAAWLAFPFLTDVTRLPVPCVLRRFAQGTSANMPHVCPGRPYPCRLRLKLHDAFSQFSGCGCGRGAASPAS